MNKKRKRILIIATAFLVLIVAGIAGRRYIPFSKLWKVSSVPESEFIKPVDRVDVPNTLFCDFEVDPKTGNTDGLYKGNAHSGQFSAKAFGKNSYSIAIDRTPAQIGVSPLNAVAVSAWVYVFPTKSEINGSFVFSANNDLGVNICWKSVGVYGSHVPQGKWFKISGYFDLSDIQWKPNFKIQVYFWNNSATDILIDDYFIVFGKGQQRRGDSTYVDMTKPEGYQPAFNKPPYPFIYLEAFDIGNQNSIYLVQDGTKKEGKIGPTDNIFVGNYSGKKDGLEDVVIQRTNGTVECFHFSVEKGRFEKATMTANLVKLPPSCVVEKSGVDGYLVKQYNPSTKNYNQSYAGKTIGPDTLKPTDQLYMQLTDAQGRTHDFRYNRDWRYDLKEVKFTENTFQILYNIDFTGYEADHNPKYYEKLTILAGRFFKPNLTSFCVVAGNYKKVKGVVKKSEWANLPELPDKVQFFNYPVVK